MADDTPTIGMLMQKLVSQCDRHLDVAAFITDLDALIAAVRIETLAKRTLTDHVVDAFLAAVDETDPQRVERIRKLFNEKLGQ